MADEQSSRLEMCPDAHMRRPLLDWGDGGDRDWTGGTDRRCAVL